ncbi:DUF333 domain-containing protein [Vibrio nigripulchritudo]|uniref:DUF333 domain-containing protein n=1 Tax=Vibrio nigripulchritudo TaxID=28173 RepID=UPI0003B23A21|nr:DUF333 domain-containing protein [Vibrio nigripulchritudo]CCN69223.1 Putative hemolysin [Vibrio nigripulchritudo SFn118]
MHKSALIGALSAVMFLSSCADASSKTSEYTKLSMANPASMYCIEQGGKIRFKDSKQGQVGICVMKDGTEIEEWEFFRQQGSGKETTAESSLGMANPASVFCEESGGKVEIEDTASGQIGICVFEDGTRIEEWEYFRNHSPKDHS